MKSIILYSFLPLTFALLTWVMPSFQCNISSIAGIENNDLSSYNFNKPDNKYKLPDKLEEISGLSYVGNGTIACIQDEKGKIHHYNINLETVEEAYKFGEKGDYEGIEVVGTTAYVLKSNGNLYEVSNYFKGDQKVKEHKSFLNSSNDTEGLAYDKKKNRLLIACKEDGGDGKEFKGNKAVYQFRLKKMKYEEEPLYKIDKDDIGELMEDEKSGNDVSFKPSGIAIHPISKQIYVISSVGNRLVILSREGKVIHQVKLDKDVFKQPEGICFAPNGDLFISNEGRGKTSNILEFKQVAQ